MGQAARLLQQPADGGAVVVAERGRIEHGVDAGAEDGERRLQLVRGVAAEPQRLLVAEFEAVERRIEHARVALDFVHDGRHGHALAELLGGDPLDDGGHFLHRRDSQRREPAAAEPGESERERQPGQQREDERAHHRRGLVEVRGDGKSDTALLAHQEAQPFAGEMHIAQARALHGETGSREIGRAPAHFRAGADLQKARRISRRQPLAHLAADILPVEFHAAVTAEFGKKVRTLRAQLRSDLLHFALMHEPRRARAADDDGNACHERGPDRETAAERQPFHSSFLST